jgi:methionyl-tRNA synthetase
MTHYVTTPIYYVNASPHLGHAYTTIAADVITRYQRQMGADAFFLTGTDEHGNKIQQAADEQGIPVQQFVDRNSQRFRDLLPLIGCEADFFIRTTDAQHREFVQTVLAKLHEQGDIFEGTYSGSYCTPCEAYYNESDLLDGGLCPIHKIPVTQLDETNWFFRLSKYEQPLRQLYADNPGWVGPKSRFNEALSFINQGLEDLSISRSSITWGVPVPWDAEHVFYVWIDALFNYASALTYAREGEDLTARFWPPALQLLAKDILKFHAVIWPALLMAAGIELPRRLLIHGYLLMAGEKMSKTGGNVFDPFPVIERHGPDPVRFYLLREVQFGQDGAVSQESFDARYTSELANDLGNLVSRTAAMTVKYRDGGVVPAAPDADIAQFAARTQAKWRGHMDEYELSAALETTWTLVRALNRHVEERAPWKLAKDESAEAASLLADTLGELVEGVCAVAWQLRPVMPATAASILGTFGVEVADGESLAWGAAAGHAVTKPEPLFPRLDVVSA